jgi:hypothetical protein
MEQQPQNVEAMLRLATAAYKRAHVERSVITTIHFLSMLAYSSIKSRG